MPPAPLDAATDLLPLAPGGRPISPGPPGGRASVGVALYKRTGRWVANVWTPSGDRGPGKRRGTQVRGRGGGVRG